MVAFQQDLAAAADAHHAVSKVAESRFLVPCAHQSGYCDTEKRDLQDAVKFPVSRQKLPQSPTPTGAACTRAGAVTRTGAALGTSAMAVPKIMITNPNQMYGTMGLR